MNLVQLVQANQLHELLNEAIATHSLETPPRNLDATPLLYFKYCQTYLNTLTSNRTHKEI